MNLKHHEWILLCIGWTFAMGQMGFAQDDVLNSRIQHTFFRNGLLIAPGTVLSRPSEVLLDTGLTTIAVDSRNPELFTADRDGTPVRVLTTSASEEMALYHDISVAIMRHPDRKLDAVSMDFTYVKEVSGREIAGIFGMSYLRELTLRIDSKVPSVSASAPTPRDDDKEQELRMDHTGRPVIKVKFPILGDRDAVLHTGADGFLAISSNQANILLRGDEAVPLTSIKFADMSGISFKQVVVIRELHILGCRYENVPAVVGTFTHLGLRFIRSKNMTMDFTRGVLTVDAVQPQQTSLIPLDASGLRLVWKDDAYTVRRVEEESAAASLGIKSGDQLLAIDGKNGTELAVWEIQDLLSAAGTTVTLQLNKGGSIRNVPLSLHHDFEYPPKWKPRSTEAEDFFSSLQEEPAK